MTTKTRLTALALAAAFATTTLLAGGSASALEPFQGHGPVASGTAPTKLPARPSPAEGEGGEGAKEECLVWYSLIPPVCLVEGGGVGARLQ
jgi:hypothetical protein